MTVTTPVGLKIGNKKSLQLKKCNIGWKICFNRILVLFNLLVGMHLVLSLEMCSQLVKQIDQREQRKAQVLLTTACLDLPRLPVLGG